MITERFKTILEELTAATADAQKCEEGNASAGRRLRKASMTAIKELKELRALVLEQGKE
jgi:hypothetical protein